jgi:hypothetical protein
VVSSNGASRHPSTAARLARGLRGLRACFSCLTLWRPQELSSLTNNGESLAAEVLFARADNVAMLAQLLAPLVLPKGSTIATVQVAASGLTVHVGQSKVPPQRPFCRLFCLTLLR